MTLVSIVKGVWRAARDAVARLNRLLAEAENSDADLVFRIHHLPDHERIADREARPLDRRES